MTPAERLQAARDALSSAFEHLDAVTGLDELEAGAVLALRADVGEAIRRLGNLLVFTGAGAKAAGGRHPEAKALQR